MQLNDILIRNNFTLSGMVRVSFFMHEDIPLLDGITLFPGEKVYLEHGKPGGYVRDSNLGGNEYEGYFPASDFARVSWRCEENPTEEHKFWWAILAGEGPIATLLQPITLQRVK